MSIDIVRRLVNGVWTTEMAASGGGGGGLTPGEPVAQTVEIEPTDPNDPAPLLDVTAPADYENVSDNGLMISTRTSAGDVVFSTDVWGGVYVKAPPGLGPGVFTIAEADTEDDRGIEMNTDSGILVKGTNAQIAVESDNRTYQTFRAVAGDPGLGSTPGVGFFNVGTQIQQPLPVTLQDVIDVLVTYGLVVAP